MPTTKLEFTFNSEKELTDFVARLSNASISTPTYTPAPIPTIATPTEPTAHPSSSASTVGEKTISNPPLEAMALALFREEATNIRASKPMLQIKPIMDKFKITKLSELDPSRYGEFLEVLKNA